MKGVVSEIGKLIFKVEAPEDLDKIEELIEEFRPLLLKALEYDEGFDADELRLIDIAARFLADQNYDLSGPEAALICCWLIITENEVPEVTSRQVSKKLAGKRKLANISATMEALVNKKLAEVRIDGRQKLKRYRLTPSGLDQAETRITEYAGSKFESFQIAEKAG